MGEAGGATSHARFSAERLVADIDGLYGELFEPTRAIVPEIVHGPAGTRINPCQ